MVLGVWIRCNVDCGLYFFHKWVILIFHLFFRGFFVEDVTNCFVGLKAG